MDDVLSIFSKDSSGEMTLGELALQLGVTLDDLQEMSLGEISTLSIEKADEETERIQEALDKREQKLTGIEQKFNIDRRDMETGTRIWFDDLLIKK